LALEREMREIEKFIKGRYTLDIFARDIAIKR